MAVITAIVANFQTRLSNKVIVGQTTAQLSSIVDKDGVNIPNGNYCFLIDKGTTNEEHFICVNTGGVLTAVKNVSRQGVETVGFKYVHQLGTEILLTDFVNIKTLSDNAGGGGTIGAILQYASNYVPTLGLFQVPAWDFVKTYVDGVVVAGAPDAATGVKGITRLSVAPAVAVTPIAVGDNDPRVPTTNEKAAMATLNTAPSTTNKFLTQSDFVGTISAYAGLTAPTGWFLCNGQAVSRATYATLFAVCGITYGIGDGTTTFNLPNLLGKVIVMQDGSQTEFDTLGETGGAKTHTLTASQLPSHTHQVVGLYTASAGAPGAIHGSGNSNSTNAFSTDVGTGGNSAHNNLQPYLVLNYIIKAN